MAVHAILMAEGGGGESDLFIYVCIYFFAANSTRTSGGFHTYVEL